MSEGMRGDSRDWRAGEIHQRNHRRLSALVAAASCLKTEKCINLPAIDVMLSSLKNISSKYKVLPDTRMATVPKRAAGLKLVMTLICITPVNLRYNCSGTAAATKAK